MISLRAVDHDHTHNYTMPVCLKAFIVGLMLVCCALYVLFERSAWRALFVAIGAWFAAMIKFYCDCGNDVDDQDKGDGFWLDDGEADEADDDGRDVEGWKGCCA